MKKSQTYQFRKELATAGWATFDGDYVTGLFGFDIPKSRTTNNDNKEVTENSPESRKIPEYRNPISEISESDSGISENVSEISELHIRKNQQIEPAKENQQTLSVNESESRFSFEQRKAYVKAVKDKKQVYSISGLARYLGNGDEDDQIAEWVETQESRAKLKAQGIVTDPEDYSMDDWITGCIERDDRAHLEMERKIIAERGGPKEPWEFRVYEYLNAATEAA